MDFRLTDEQLMLQDAVTSLLADLCTGADLRRMLAEESLRDQRRWDAIVAMGLPGLMAPERTGGAGLGAVEMALVATAAGYALLPEPLVDHAGVAMPLVAGAGGYGIDPADGQTFAVMDPFSGLVADADTAALLLLVDHDAVHIVRRDAVPLTRARSFDPFRRLFRVEWRPDAATRLDVAPAAWAAAVDRGALFSAAQLIGLAQRAVDLAVDYAKERHQFGKPIGSFQAIKHHLASAQTKIEFARPVVRAAAALLDAEAPLAAVRIAHAKVAAAAAADLAAHAAVQIHGAMGYSWEVDVHFVLKRALALGQAWGTPDHHRARLLAHVARAPLGPDRTFGAPFIPEATRELA